MATKAEIMAALTAQKEKTQGSGDRPRNLGDNASYAFWNLPEGGSATVRFLPDADQDNLYFWRERLVCKLPFAGVEGGEYPTNKEVSITVPCVEMWGHKCPITEGIRHLWKGTEEEKNLARVYYKKRSYIFQGFVVADGLGEENAPENPIRRFVINPSIFGKIEKALMDPEMEDLPFDYDNGTDFRIVKTKRGDYANYDNSDWSRKTRPLSDAERQAIETHGLFDLKTYLGQEPDAEGIKLIGEMFADSFAGKAFDFEKYGHAYRPYGARAESVPATSSLLRNVNEPPAETKADVKPEVDAIRDRIMNRTKTNAA